MSHDNHNDRSKWKLRLLAGFFAVLICLTGALMTACTDPDKGPVNTPSGLESQLRSAEKTLNNFYSSSERRGGLFASVTPAATARAYFDAAAPAGITLDDVRNVISKYSDRVHKSHGLLRSFVSDIFTYSQIQLALIEQLGTSSLMGQAELNYDGIDWDKVSDDDLCGVSKSWFVSVLPHSASFPGADEATGRVYCDQTHIAYGNNVVAKLEYYYNSDSDLGVTTLNWHYNDAGKPVGFEYNFCDIGIGMALTLNFSYREGELVFSQFVVVTEIGTLYNTVFSADDIELIQAYVALEIVRISSRIDELVAQNAQQAETEGVTAPSEDASVSVDLDFSVLKTMIGQN